jgi:hypothetical protein
MFGPKTEEVTGGCRSLQNEELYNFYASPDILMVSKSRRMDLAGYVARMRDDKCVQNTGRKSEDRRPFERLRQGWKDNVITDLREIRWEVVDWIHPAQDRDRWQAVVNTVMNLRVP